ncbi:hypothetical protein Tco_0995164, partial [Tanacetum coccineum]
SSTLGILVDTTTAATDVNPDLAGPSHLEESEGSDDSFYAPPTLNPSEAKRWYVPRWNITNDSLLDDGFSCRTLVDRVAPPAFFSALRTMDYDQQYTEFNVGATRQMCLGADVRSRAEHELKLKEKLRVEYAARGRLLEEKDLKILREKPALTAEVSVLKVTVTQKDHDISLLNSRASCLASTLDDAKVARAEAGDKITSLASERDRLVSEGILGHALGRAVDFGMQEGLEAGYEHGASGRNLSVVDAYNPEVAKASYINAVKALEDVYFPFGEFVKVQEG